MTELEFIQQPGEWPRWPVMPVVARKKFVCGLVFADGKPDVIVGANIFSLGEIPGHTWAEKFHNAGFETKHYDSFEQLLTEWRLD